MLHHTVDPEITITQHCLIHALIDVDFLRYQCMINAVDHAYLLKDLPLVQEETARIHRLDDSSKYQPVKSMKEHIEHLPVASSPSP